MKKQYSVPGFSERLKRAIFETGKTTAEIAAESGIPRYCLYNYIDLGVTPYGGNLVKICKYLGVSADWLLGLEE